MPDDQTTWVTVARLLRPQGRKGELLADLLTDFPERFTAPSKVFVTAPESKRSPDDLLSLEISSSWLPHGRNEGRVVLGFTTVHSIEEAERLSGMEVLIPATDRLELTDGSVYIEDLIGCTLHDKGLAIGTIRDVQFTTSADGRRRLAEAAPLLVVELPVGEALIPFVTEFVVTLDLTGKRVLMNLPEGLVGLNLDPPAAST